MRLERWIALPTVLWLLSLGPTAHAHGWDKTIKETKSRVASANRQAERSIDNAVKESTTDSTGAGTGAPAPDAGTCRFVPGGRAVFRDSLAAQDLDSPPSGWTVESGTFHVVRRGEERWIACLADGALSPGIDPASLAAPHTIAMDFVDGGATAPGYRLRVAWVDAKKNEIGYFQVARDGVLFSLLETSFADRTFEATLSRGVHSIRVTAGADTIACCVDGESVTVLPRPKEFTPAGLSVQVRPYGDDPAKNPVLFRGFEVAAIGN